MSIARLCSSALAACGAAALLALAAPARAGGYGYDRDELSWSVTVAQPGLRVAVSNAPMWGGYAPLVVHAPPPAVVVAPPPVVVWPAAVVPHPHGRHLHHGHGWHHGHHKHGHHKHHGWVAYGGPAWNGAQPAPAAPPMGHEGRPRFGHGHPMR